MMKEYWIYQERQCEKPWAIMLEVESLPSHETPYSISAYVYHETLDPCALIVGDMRYKRCWRYAVRIALAMSLNNIGVTESDIVQLEHCMGDVIADYQSVESLAYYAKYRRVKKEIAKNV